MAVQVARRRTLEECEAIQRGRRAAATVTNAAVGAETAQEAGKPRVKLAEEEGFEPPDPEGSAVFKTAAIDHSATPPRP